MRPIHSLPLVAAILLAACGGGADEADGVSGEDAAAAAAGAPSLEPGQYEVSYELLEFDIPGAPESVKQQAQAAMGGASEVAKGFSFCLSPEEAAKGPQGMVEQMAERDCTFAKFDVSGGTVSADMQCAEDGGSTIRMLMDGEISSTSSDMTLTVEQEIAGIGAVRMKSRAISRRTGDCV